MIPKFRAWYTPFGGSVKQFNKMKHGSAGSLLTHAEMSPDDYKIMQSTGLIDRNGVEIFEGDIVKRAGSSKPKDELLEIGFANGSFYSTFIPDWCRTSLFDYVDFGKQVEVIGNVWEDGDLINDGKRTKEN